MRRLGEGVEDYGKYILHYKGETPGLYGVGFLIKQELMRNVVEIKGISEKIAVLNIKLPLHHEKDTNWSIIQVYSPTEPKNKQGIAKIELFYKDLQTTIQNSCKNIIIMGDFNGQVGVCNPGEDYTIGKYGYGKRSKNGERLVTLALENKLKILNTFYNKKISRKWTWISPNGSYKNEVDYILSNNFRVFKNISIINQLNFNSDHRMVRATIRGTRIKRNRRLQNKVNSLICLGNNDKLLSCLKTRVNSIEQCISIQDKYDSLLNILKSETTKINNEAKKKLLSSKSKQLLEQRKELIKKGKEGKKNRQKIASLSKEINESIRRDHKTRRQNTLKKHIERSGGTKKAFKELNYKKDWMLHLKNKDKDYTSKRQEILRIATEFYRELYTEKQPEDKEKLDTWLNPAPVPFILTEETIKAINSQKTDKAPGSDQITNELLKTTASVIAPILTNLFNEILRTENIPPDWMKSTIILLHKKGDKGDINNYRPISLMSNIYKVFSKIILSRIANVLDENQPKEQAGFRSNCSTIEHIHVLRQVLQKYREYKKTYYIGFVDFHKAFDSLEHKYIWKALKCQGVQMKYIRILNIIYSGSTAQVKLETTGEPFPVQRGVRQGDPVSPKLFTAVLEMIFRNLEWEDIGLNINGQKLNHLRFADDLILFSEDSRRLERMLQQLAEESATAGLSMNISKTKIMTNAQQSDLDAIMVNEKEIEYVNEYIYLGQLISPLDNMPKEIDRRITMTWKRFWSLSEIMKNEEMSIKIKRTVYNTCILPCLTYGCQTWALTDQLSNKIKVCQNSIERSVIGLRRRDRVKLETIKTETKFKNAHIVSRRLKWRWAGHMLRDTKEKWTKIITEWCPMGDKRNKGRPCKRWEDDFRQMAGAKWTRIARDRTAWKSLEEAFVERQAATHKEITDIL
ncbi:unnamed protein product [Arctia plantaginis]|uniref:Reverse transcriptase domain-containing protein n=1 Tax=Arctia plantaginis TaxID=874455 RepID=A0A8S0Z5L5_ARCPL|nr:unnamed protein product [Arctia plantaginis]